MWKELQYLSGNFTLFGQRVDLAMVLCLQLRKTQLIPLE